MLILPYQWSIYFRTFMFLQYLPFSIYAGPSAMWIRIFSFCTWKTELLWNMCTPWAWAAKFSVNSALHLWFWHSHQAEPGPMFTGTSIRLCEGLMDWAEASWKQFRNIILLSSVMLFCFALFLPPKTEKKRTSSKKINLQALFFLSRFILPSGDG